MNSGILNRSLFRIQINFSEMLQEIQSVEKKKKIDSDDYRGIYQDYDIENKRLCWLNLPRVLSVPLIPNQTLWWKFFVGARTSNDGHALGQLFWSSSWLTYVGVGALLQTKVKGGRRKRRWRKIDVPCASWNWVALLVTEEASWPLLEVRTAVWYSTTLRAAWEKGIVAKNMVVFVSQVDPVVKSLAEESGWFKG